MSARGGRSRRAAARENPASAGGIILTLVGFGVMAFSAVELVTGGRAFKARPAPPKLGPHKPAAPTAPASSAASKPAKPAPPTPRAQGAPSTPSTTAASGGGTKPPTPAQVQQAVQAGQAIVSGAESLFGGSSTDTGSTDTGS